MKGNFWGRAGITLGIVGSILLMLACAIKGHLLLGMWMFVGCLVLLVAVVALISRSRRNDEELDPLSDAGRTARFVKSHKTKPVYEHDSDIWDQMKGSGDTDTSK